MALFPYFPSSLVPFSSVIYGHVSMSTSGVSTVFLADMDSECIKILALSLTVIVNIVL